MKRVTEEMPGEVTLVQPRAALLDLRHVDAHAAGIG